MNAEITSRIIGLSRDNNGNGYELTIKQSFNDSTLVHFVSLFISESTAIRLVAMLHLDWVDALIGKDLHFFIENEHKFSVKFELCGCFSTIYKPAPTKFPTEAIISNMDAKRAPGIASITLFNELPNSGYPFSQDYFLSEKYFDDLNKALSNDGRRVIKDYVVTIREAGRCYCEVSLPAEKIKVNAQFA